MINLLYPNDTTQHPKVSVSCTIINSLYFQVGDSRAKSNLDKINRSSLILDSNKSQLLPDGDYGDPQV